MPLYNATSGSTSDTRSHCNTQQEQQFQASEEEQRQEFESLCEEIKNKNMEDLNVLRMMLEQQIEDLEQHFQNAAEGYSANTKDKVQKFKEYTQRDRKDATTIDAQMKRLLRLQALTDTNTHATTQAQTHSDALVQTYTHKHTDIVCTHKPTHTCRTTWRCGGQRFRPTQKRARSEMHCSARKRMPFRCPGIHVHVLLLV